MTDAASRRLSLADIVAHLNLTIGSRVARAAPARTGALARASCESTASKSTPATSIVPGVDDAALLLLGGACS